MTGLLTRRELATVLAALRHWQDYLAEDDLVTMPWDHFDQTTPPLDITEIDALCERLNCGPLSRR